MKKITFIQRILVFPCRWKKRGGQILSQVVTGSFLGLLMASSPAYAAESVVSGVNNLTSLVTTIIAAVGTVVLAQGIWDFASAYRSHDSGTQTQAIRGIVAGLIMISASAIISLIRG